MNEEDFHNGNFGGAVSVEDLDAGGQDQDNLDHLFAHAPPTLNRRVSSRDHSQGGVKGGTNREPTLLAQPIN